MACDSNIQVALALLGTHARQLIRNKYFAISPATEIPQPARTLITSVTHGQQQQHMSVLCRTKSAALCAKQPLLTNPESQISRALRGALEVQDSHGATTQKEKSTWNCACFDRARSFSSCKRSAARVWKRHASGSAVAEKPACWGRLAGPNRAAG